MTKMRVHELAKELGMDNKETRRHSSEEKRGDQESYEHDRGRCG